MKWFQYFSFSIIFLIFLANNIIAGSYKDSAHGNLQNGVNRLSGYATGNCAHCHEMHTGGGSFSLFSQNFNTSKRVNPYEQGDNFCFYCHCYPDQQTNQTSPFYNHDYSHIFGGYIRDPEPKSIFSAFNQNSSHNLYDIWEFAKTHFDFFKEGSNPCVACHNPHLARRNKENPGDPTYSAISLPSNHTALWTKTMEEIFQGQYQAPYYWNGSSTNPIYEPDGILGTREEQAKKTLDYVTFCTDCHNPNYTIYSRELGRNLLAINWAQEKHGLLNRNEGGGDGKEGGEKGYIISPYDENGSINNYVLSCLDCHEPHGSYSYKYLIRKEVNGKITNVADDTRDHWETLCSSCHYFTDHGNGTCIKCHKHGSGKF